MSHLIRGAWIEINHGKKMKHLNRSHLIRGAWIEILKPPRLTRTWSRRISYEVRGLKSLEAVEGYYRYLVASHTRCVD